VVPARRFLLEVNSNLLSSDRVRDRLELQNDDLLHVADRAATDGEIVAVAHSETGYVFVQFQGEELPEPGMVVLGVVERHDSLLSPY
jgi:hypothetical protein